MIWLSTLLVIDIAFDFHRNHFRFSSNVNLDLSFSFKQMFDVSSNKILFGLTRPKTQTCHPSSGARLARNDPRDQLDEQTFSLGRRAHKQRQGARASLEDDERMA